MKSTLFTIFLSLSLSFWVNGQEDSVQLTVEDIENSLHYQTGTIEFKSAHAKLIVPKGFRFLDKKQSIYVLTELWGNPKDNTILGMLFPENVGALSEDGWAYTISYEAMGYVEDGDASDIDYNEMLTEQQKEFKDENPARKLQGYESIEFIGWASTPHYDNTKKVLHWARELKFGNSPIHTLNYNLRVLGRKGVIMLNAVATMNELPQVKHSIKEVLGSVKYKEGYKYADFNESSDHVAEWSIGGLVAGKILAKVGFFALIVKFWKILAVAVVGGGAWIWKKIKRNKEEAAILTASPQIEAIEDPKIEA